MVAGETASSCQAVELLSIGSIGEGFEGVHGPIHGCSESPDGSLEFLSPNGDFIDTPIVGGQRGERAWVESRLEPHSLVFG